MVEREESAGFVVFRLEGSVRKYLLLHKPATGIYKEAWAFPKGLVEKGESELETAKRETAEEAGIKELKVISGFKETVKYFYRREDQMVAKTVVWFLGQTENAKAKVSFEHKEAGWFSYDEAQQRLTFKSDKEVLKKAEKYLVK